MVPAAPSSKPAVLALTYAVECEGTNVKVNLINPGPMRTLMRQKAMPGEDPAYLVKPEEMAFKVVEMLSPSYALNETIINFRK